MWELQLGTSSKCSFSEDWLSQYPLGVNRILMKPTHYKSRTGRLTWLGPARCSAGLRGWRSRGRVPGPSSRGAWGTAWTESPTASPPPRSPPAPSPSRPGPWGASHHHSEYGILSRSESHTIIDHKAVRRSFICHVIPFYGTSQYNFTQKYFIILKFPFSCKTLPNGKTVY